jgi:DNA-binding IclR family transcriptional regulator
MRPGAAGRRPRRHRAGCPPRLRRQALLAALDDRQVTDLYTDHDLDVPQLLKELALVRARDPRQQPLAALTLAFPTVRFNRTDLPSYVSSLAAAASGIQRDLTTASGSS